MRRETSRPSVTAGLMWQPETGPMAYAIASSERPNASAIPRLPILSPAMTAAPTPPKTSTNVPRHSAPARLIGISPSFPSLRTDEECHRSPVSSRTRIVGRRVIVVAVVLLQLGFVARGYTSAHKEFA